MIELKWKRVYLNRTYLRIRYFWKYNFSKSYKKVKWYHLIWQVPFIVLISVYNALSTRYDFISTVYLGRALLLLIIFQDKFGFYLLLLFFIPLLNLTILVLLPPISNSLKISYGENTLKKLGFNHFGKFGQYHGVKVAKLFFAVAGGTGAYEVSNFHLEEWKIRTETQNVYSTWQISVKVWENQNSHGRITSQLCPEPPSSEVLQEIRARVKQERVLPPLIQTQILKWVKPSDD